MDKIICVGKNYLEHAKELGDAIPEKPVLFLKPPSVLEAARSIGDTVIVRFPTHRGAVHYECEIVLKLREISRPIRADEAKKFVSGVTLGLDMTLREEQGRLKKAGHPWELAKVFQSSAIVGPWFDETKLVQILDEEFKFLLDGKVRQKGEASQMTLSWAECIEYASQYFPIREGDLLFTGTPAGVGPWIEGSVGELTWGKQSLFKVSQKK